MASTDSKDVNTFKMRRFEGKIVIVTGSSSGIGQATAIRFGSEGAKVTIHGRNPEGIEETRQKLQKVGVLPDNILAVLGEVVNDTTLHALIDNTVQKFGKIDILINNAGGSGDQVGLDTNELESVDYILDMNLKAPMKLVDYATPHLEKTKGNIVNVSSVDGIRPHYDAMYYSVSKAALDHYTRCMCNYMAEKGIRINNINPGWIETNILKRGGVSAVGQKVFESTWVKQMVPMQRSGTSEEIANVVCFLASEEASFMTGSMVVADGGLICHSPSQKTWQKP